jgi:AraC family ethanolamine operon transcriptional activator
MVGQVAGDWGFYHLGQFSRDYRRLFGESPSATLARHRA